MSVYFGKMFQQNQVPCASTPICDLSDVMWGGTVELEATRLPFLFLFTPAREGGLVYQCMIDLNGELQ